MTRRTAAVALCGLLCAARPIAEQRTPDDVASVLQRQTQVLALRNDPPAIELPDRRLDEYVGTYALIDSVTYMIRREGHALVGVRSGRAPEMLNVELLDCLFVPGQPRLRKIFQRNADGRITGFVERRETWDIAWRRRP